MSGKIVVFICAQALFAHVAFSQCVRSGEYNWGLIGPSVGLNPYGCIGANNIAYGSGLGFANAADWNTANIEAIPTSGGAFPIQSSTSIVPNGISVTSENAYEGSLIVNGELPFLSAIAFEGALPSAGAGTINYSCGNGITAITSEVGNAVQTVGIGSAGIGPVTIGYGSGLGSLGGAGWTNLGGIAGPAGYQCGCRLY